MQYAKLNHYIPEIPFRDTVTRCFNLKFADLCKFTYNDVHVFTTNRFFMLYKTFRCIFSLCQEEAIL
jgi:hypothetical protein